MDDVLYAYTGGSLLQVHNSYTIEKPEVSHVIEKLCDMSHTNHPNHPSLELLCRVDPPSLESDSFKCGLVRLGYKIRVQVAAVKCIAGSLGAITDQTQYRTAIDPRTHCFISFVYDDASPLPPRIECYATAILDIPLEVLRVILRNNKLVLFEREELSTLARNSTEAWVRARRIGSRDNFFALTESNAVALGV